MRQKARHFILGLLPHTATVRLAQTLGRILSTSQPRKIAKDMNSIQVRQAVFADLDALSDIFDQYRVFQGKSSDIEAASAFLKARFDHGESVVFLAEELGSAVGMAQLFPIYSSVSLARVFILNDLFVTQAGRRKGVATTLLAKIEEYAKANQAARISLNVAHDNLEGQALYESRGWCKDSEFFMYHRYPTRS